MIGLKTFYTKNRLTPAYLILWPLLLVLSCLYFCVVSLLRFVYQKNILRPYQARVKVISVGNITLGGSGKTPLVEYLSLHLSSRSRLIAVLLRGYKKPQLDIGIGVSDYYSIGDEASMLKTSLKGNAVVISDKDRKGAVEEIDEEGRFDMVILDDGFQHWRLKRDLDIVVIDSTNPFGNGCVLPLGPLREGISSLKRAHVICLSRVNEVPSVVVAGLEGRLRKINPAALFIKTVHEPEFFYDAVSGAKVPLGDLKDKKAGLLCAIANPGSFLKAVEQCGTQVVSKDFFDDHHEYSEDDLAKVVHRSKDAGAGILVTTQKDVVRFGNWLLKEKPGISIFVLKVSLRITEGEPAFDERLYSLYRA